MKTSIMIVIGICLSSSALADKPKEFAKADTPEAFATTAASIRKDMEVGGRFEFIAPSQKADANHDLDTMLAMLQKSGGVATMNMQDKVTLFNVQEHVNGILTHSDSERLVCERVGNVGSNIPTTTCKTYGEIQRARRDTQDFVSRNMTHDPQLQSQKCPVARLGTNMATCNNGSAP